VWDDMNNLEPVRYYDKGVIPDHYSSFGEFHMILRDGQITIPKIALFEPLQRQDADFIDCIRARSTPRADGACALAVVQVMEAALASLKNHGKAMPVPAS
jgi:predicted dehydrogenase